MYETYAGAFSDYLRMPLPPWVPVTKENDQWKMLTKLRAGTPMAVHDEHGH